MKDHPSVGPELNDKELKIERFFLFPYGMAKRNKPDESIVDVSDDDEVVALTSNTSIDGSSHIVQNGSISSNLSCCPHVGASESTLQNILIKSSDTTIDGASTIIAETTKGVHMMQHDENQNKSRNTKDGGCSEPPTKKCKYDHEIICDQHHEQVEYALESATTIFKTIEQIRSQVKSIAENLPSSTSRQPPSNKFRDIANEVIASLPGLVCRIRRHHRVLSIVGEKSVALLDEIKGRHRHSREALLAAATELGLISQRVSGQMIATPKLEALIPHLYPKEEYEESRKLVNPEAQEVPGRNAIEVLQHLRTAAFQNSDDQPAIASDLEEYLLNWLRFDLACRERDNVAVDSVRLRREAEEEKLKFLKKRETDLVQKISPIEKKLQELLSTIAGQSSSIPTLPSSLPPEAFSLPPPLFHIYSSLFAYKALNFDRSLDLRITKAETKSPGSLFEPYNFRLQLSIDKTIEELPPPTYAKAAALFPLSVRFTFLPRLQLVCALCQFPRLMGSDSTFLGDLLFQNDDGMVSPNPLHHAIYDLESLENGMNGDIPKLDKVVAMNSEQPQEKYLKIAHVTPSSDNESKHIFSVCLPSTPSTLSPAAKTIAMKLLQMEHGRPYRWTQALAGIIYGVAETADQLLKDLLPPTVPPVTAKRFIEAFRSRAALRSWTLYIEEVLKDKPSLIPPPSVQLPPELISTISSVASAIRNVTTSTVREFLNAGGNPLGVAATSTYRDVHFLKIALDVSQLQFTVFIALPLDARDAEFCIHLKLFPSSDTLKGIPLSLSQFSLFDFSRHPLPDTAEISSIIEKLEPEEKLGVEEMLMQWDELKLSEKKNIAWNTEEIKVDLGSADGKRARILLELLPAGNTAWSSNQSAGDRSAKRTLSHYRNSRLAAIQENINITVPKSFGGRESGNYSRSMVIIQLVTLVVSFVVDAKIALTRCFTQVAVTDKIIEGG